MSFGGSCYLINQVTQDYYKARDWCAKKNATLVSINNADENEFIWKICHSEPDPLTYPKTLTRSTCWLGMREKTGTGMRDTPQDRQKWEWLDGSTPDWGPKSNKYRNWALRPGMGDGQGDGNKYYEPNNEKSKMSPAGTDVRHAIMNQQEGGMSGRWYDKPAQFRAQAACEQVPQYITAGVQLLEPWGGWPSSL